jgi:hypothetical protein
VKSRVLPKAWNRWVLDTDYGFDLYNSKSEAKLAAKVQRLHPSEYDIYEESMTIRQFLQLAGTDAMRENLHPNIWVNALFSDYKVIGYTNAVDIENPTEIIKTPNYPSWLITDVRFPNEADAIINGLPGQEVDYSLDFRFLIRVDRPSLNNDNISNDFLHESEVALDDYENFDYTIVNDGDLQDLGFKVYDMLKSIPEFGHYFHI